uniref:Uncharacterized protein n=1 Tax=Anguilla anguilla TaxID=7936 RepID=A0A0E9SYX1_ANGAN
MSVYSGRVLLNVLNRSSYVIPALLIRRTFLIFTFFNF